MRKRLFACVVVACSLATPRAEADSQVADTRVAALLAQADQSSLALRIDEAMARVDDAIALAEKVGDRVGLAMSHRMKGTTFLRGSRPSDGAVWFERALAGFEALGNRPGMASALEGLTAVAVSAGDYTKAAAFGNRALELLEETGDDRLRASVLMLLVRSGLSPDLAAGRIREVLDIASRLSDHRLRGDALSMRAGGQFGAGDLSGARASYEEAIAAIEKTPYIQALAATYLSLGRVFRAHGDYEGALQRYQKAIDLLAPTKERYTLVEATNASATALGYLNRHTEAIAAYERGLALARESGNQRLIDFMEGNLAGGLMAAKQYDRAIPALEAVIAKKPEPSLLAFRQTSLALALTNVGRGAEAVPLIDEAIRLSRELKLFETLGYRLGSRSWILTKLGRFEEALADSREAITIVEQIRTRLIPSDFLKRGFSEQAQNSYLGVVDLLSRLDRGAEALEFAEQGRARAFLDLLAAREAPDATLTTRGDTTKPGPRADLASESMGAPLDITGMRRLAGRLKSTVVSYWVNDEATLIWVVRPDAEPTHTRVPITREKLAALVAATTAPLREAAKATTTRGVDASTPPQATPDDLTALPLRGLGLLALTRDDKSSWRELYKTLIEPVRAQLPARGGRLTIVPHGPLFHVSFAALRSAASRYLVEDYDIHYAPAISALEFTGRRQQTAVRNAAGPWAIVGNPATLPVVGDRPLPPLPGAAREITSVSGFAPRGRAMRLDGAGADEAALVRTLEANPPSVLHFATHGFVFDDPKQAPFLALNRRGTTDADDGRLTVDEVYGLRLSTDLVVLSACRTGSGQVSSDGMVGLTRGFFYAGTPSVMATFWDVTDDATAILMSRFYRSYVQARAKSSSLRSAQLALLADLRAGKVVVTASGRRVTLPEHPLLWAAFFLSGEP